MEAYHVVRTHPLEHVAIEPALAEIVLAVDFDPADSGPRAQKIPIVLRA
jgi:hypothetical protein